MKTALQTVCSVILTLTFLAPVAAQAQTSATGTLKGVVTDPTGAVVTGTLIRIVYWGRSDYGKPPEKDMAVYIDKDGQFKCELAPGIYDVFVSAPDFSPAARQVKVESRKETIFNPKLRFSRFIKLVP